MKRRSSSYLFLISIFYTNPKSNFYYYVVSSNTSTTGTTSATTTTSTTTSHRNTITNNVNIEYQYQYSNRYNSQKNIPKRDNHNDYHHNHHKAITRSLRSGSMIRERDNDDDTYGSSSYNKPSSSSSSSSSSYGSYGSYGTSSSSSLSKSKGGKSSTNKSFGSYTNYKYQHEEPMIPLAWVILLIITSVAIGMLITANEFISNTEGNIANFCRLSVNTLDCIWKIIYNCYKCQLSEIPNVVWSGGVDDNEESYTEQELQRMKCRPGIERALEVEHQRSMNKLRNEFKKKKTEMGNKIAKKVGVVERGPGLVALLGQKKTYMKVSTDEN
jgi:hypothetical protein